MNYEEFIQQKSQGANDGGFEPLWMPDFLFDFQRSLVEWSLRKGRAVTLWSNIHETVLTPFMGVGSEAYGALINGRRAVGFELKETYYKQALRNLELACQGVEPTEESLFTADGIGEIGDDGNE